MKPSGMMKTGSGRMKWIGILFMVIVCLSLLTAAFADTEPLDYDREAEIEKVLNTARKKVEENPDDPFAYADLGSDLFWAKRYEEAAEAYTIAIEMDPESADVHIIYNRRGHANKYIDTALALADYTRAITLRPDVGVYYYNRAGIYQVMGNTDAAEADLQMSTDLAQDQSLPFRQRASALMDEYKFDEAIIEYTKGIEANPRSGNVYHGRGNAFFNLLQYEEAAADYTRAIDMFPESHQYYRSRGAARFFMGQFDLAAEDYSKAIDLRPAFAYTDYIYRARAYQALGNTAAAEADLIKTSEMTTHWVKWSTPCWVGGLFMLPDFSFTFTVPEGAKALTEEEIAVINADPGKAPTDPFILFKVVSPEQDLHFSIGYKTYKEGENFTSYTAAYTQSFEKRGITRENMIVDTAEFAGCPAVWVSAAEGDNVSYAFLIDREDTLFDSDNNHSENGVYVIAGLAPFMAYENGLMENFVNELVAPAYAILPGREEAFSNSFISAPQGSAKFLEGKSLLVSIFLTNEDSVWSSPDISRAAQKLDIAVKFIIEEGKRYGKNVELIYDFEQYPDLSYDMTFSGIVYEPPFDYIYSAEIRDTIRNTSSAMLEYIESQVPYLKLAGKYETDSIAFVVFMNYSSPRSYTKIYSYHDLDTYNEVCFVFDDSPYVYAHELLHLFGAEDLYNELAYHEIGKEVVAYAKQNFPKDIMIGDKGIDLPDSIPYEISRLTAYNLAWLDDIPETELFPTLRHDFPAVLNIGW